MSKSFFQAIREEVEKDKSEERAKFVVKDFQAIFKNKGFDLKYRLNDPDINFKATKSLGDNILVVSFLSNPDGQYFVQSLRSLVQDKDGNILKVKRGESIESKEEINKLEAFIDSLESLSETTQTTDIAQKQGPVTPKEDEKILGEKCLYEDALSLDTEEEFKEYLQDALEISTELQMQIEEGIANELGDKEFAVLPLFLGENLEVKGLLVVTEDKDDLEKIGNVVLEDIEASLVVGDGEDLSYGLIVVSESIKNQDESSESDEDNLEEEAPREYQDANGKLRLVYDIIANNEVFKLEINGKPYYYRPKELSMEEFENKFLGLAKHSVGRALQWVKANSTLDPAFKELVEEEETDPNSEETDPNSEETPKDDTDNVDEEVEDIQDDVELLKDVALSLWEFIDSIMEDLNDEEFGKQVREKTLSLKEILDKEQVEENEKPIKIPYEGDEDNNEKEE